MPDEIDWQARREFVQCWIPLVDRPTLERFAQREFDRAECGWLGVLRAHSDPALIAQRQASHAVSAALDWTPAGAPVSPPCSADAG